MTAVKTCWSILVLEDNPGLRESLRSNFAVLLGEAVHVEFAASICHAIDKIKQRMRRGDPYDLFWIDLYLDYFSYENDHGEIVAPDSFAQIIDLAAFQQRHPLAELRLISLLHALEVTITPPHKNPQHYTAYEKLRVLQKFTPFCLPAAKSSYESLLELVELHLRSTDHEQAEQHEENTYAGYALDFVFRQLLQWVASPAQKELALSDDDFEAWEAPLHIPLLPEREVKSDQSWTLFHAWVQQFYNHVALGVKHYEDYHRVNPLLAELIRLKPDGYPQFLVNTAYPSRRRDMLQASAVWPAENVTVAHHDFKGGTIDDDLVDYLFRLCRRLRQPYLLMRSRRRGANTFSLDEHLLSPLPALQPDQILLSDREFGLQFTAKSFFPDLMGHFEKHSEISTAAIAELRALAWREVQQALLERQPATVQKQWLFIPTKFFSAETNRDHFRLAVETVSGKRNITSLTFDEGRWILLELVCRRWFPKCFLMHSTWTTLEDRQGRTFYFYTAQELLTNALMRAAIDYPDLFPPPHDAGRLGGALRPTHSFHLPETDYLSAFDWPFFLQEVFGALDTLPHHTPRMVPVAHARRLLILAKYLMAELHIKRVAYKLLKPNPITPRDLPALLEAAEFIPAEKTLNDHLRRLEKSEMAYSLAEDLLPGLQNFLSIILCFYALPSPELAQFYRFWLGKQIPMEGTRPIEKFSTVGRKLDYLKFMQSLPLPAQAEGKNRFLFVSAAEQSELLVYHNELSAFDNSSAAAADNPTPLDFLELSQRISSATL